MSGEILYSVRMRAALGGAHEDGGAHLSGAERLVFASETEAAAAALIARALSRGVPPDFVRLTVERVDAVALARVPVLPLTTIPAPDPTQARRVAEGLLRDAGVSPSAVACAFHSLQNGFGAENASLRGAAIFDLLTGDRLDPPTARGVRATHFDYAPGARDAVAARLAARGLTHFRTLDALAVATKVLWSGARAELCWSDEPEYVAGYVAAPACGYTRFPYFKPTGARGGRVFFVDRDRWEDVRDCLERAPVWVEA
ncbi:6-carboxyhexanoate--CoA ligase [Capsulimonas corticalis]|uniref:6-carboxyhexanoate--CoA ligase n=1 Tax=Capsulimonas corticalis TaxID=2219043 RepID=A0A402CZ20_9BACT|nr:6-carboxyhexanoate--CoA ligase [Capsulimonas corticalis]BDI29593.1 6-carboxyhexanoate--CoA ligase [Capsulimonas corticalis]